MPAGEPKKETAPPSDVARPRTLSSAELFGEARRLLIRHRGREYVLIITKQDKLVLNRMS